MRADFILMLLLWVDVEVRFALWIAAGFALAMTGRDIAVTAMTGWSLFAVMK